MTLSCVSCKGELAGVKFPPPSCGVHLEGVDPPLTHRNRGEPRWKRARTSPESIWKALGTEEGMSLLRHQLRRRQDGGVIPSPGVDLERSRGGGEPVPPPESILKAKGMEVSS
jgi:hypothetical protein